MPKDQTPEWEDEYKLFWFETGKYAGRKQGVQEHINFIRQVRQQAIEETIDYISLNEGWEETGDKYRKVFNIEPKYSF